MYGLLRKWKSYVIGGNKFLAAFFISLVTDIVMGGVVGKVKMPRIFVLVFSIPIMFTKVFP